MFQVRQLREPFLQGNAPFLLPPIKCHCLRKKMELTVFQVFKVSADQSSDSSLVTPKVPSGNFIRFEIDTGARCNVLPIHIYK